MSKGKMLGYIRVSSVDQNTDRQLEDIKVDRLFLDKASGKNSNRSKLIELLDYARDGDMIVVHSMDRLSRNLDDLRKIVSDCTSRSIHIQFIKENITFTGQDSPIDKLLLSMMGAFAEFERAIISERQREGIVLAKAKGVYQGRKRKLTNEQVIFLKERIANRDNKSQIARDLNISRDTLYQYINVFT